MWPMLLTKFSCKFKVHPNKLKFSSFFISSVFLVFVVHTCPLGSSLSVPRDSLELADKVGNESELEIFPTTFFEEESETTSESYLEENILPWDSDSNSTDESASAKPLLDCQCGRRFTLLEADNLAGFTDDKITSKQVSELIVGGNSTFRGEFPWLAALLKINPFANAVPRVICGATLINSRFLLTAAHCISRQVKERLSVAFNAYKITTAADVRQDPEVLTVGIKRLIPHAKFSSRTVDNDVGLIELAEPLDLVKLKDKIRPACLPTTAEDKYEGKIGTVSGWGYLRPAAGVSSPELRKAEVPILDQDKCKKTAYGPKILNSMLCAGYDEGGVDACTNDSGGPLTITDDNSKNTLVGVVSWGHSCAKPKLPGVYARVGNYLDWIGQHARKGDYCMQSSNN